MNQLLFASECVCVNSEPFFLRPGLQPFPSVLLTVLTTLAFSVNVCVCMFVRVLVHVASVRICYSNQAVRVIWSILAGRHTDSPPAGARP